MYCTCMHYLLLCVHQYDGTLHISPCALYRIKHNSFKNKHNYLYNYQIHVPYPPPGTHFFAIFNSFSLSLKVVVCWFCPWPPFDEPGLSWEVSWERRWGVGTCAEVASLVTWTGPQKILLHNKHIELHTAKQTCAELNLHHMQSRMDKLTHMQSRRDKLTSHAEQEG